MAFFINFGSGNIFFTVAIGIAVILFEVLVDIVFADEKKILFARKIARGLLIAGLAFLFFLTLENLRKLEKIEGELIGVNEKATAFEFFKPYETIQALDDNSAFQLLLKSQMDKTRERLKEIEKGELRLNREEVVPVWEALISKFSSKEVIATNVVSSGDWQKFSPNQGLEAHEEYLSKSGTEFKRLFIYDSKDANSLEGTKKLADQQLSLAQSLKATDRFQIKMMDKNSIDNNTYGASMYSTFGTLDIVVFDRQCLLETVTQFKNGAYEIVNGVVTNDKVKIALAQEMFVKLWNKAESIDQFKEKNPNATNSP